MYNMNRYTGNIPDQLTARALTPLLRRIYTRLGSQIMSTGGLAIKAGSSKLAKTVNTVYYVANGVYGALSAADMPALTGLVISQAKYNVAVFLVDSAGTTSVIFGTEGATAGAVIFPEIPAGKAPIGFMMITKSDGAFTGDSTLLDAANTTIVYVNTVGPFEPTATVTV